MPTPVTRLLPIAALRPIVFAVVLVLGGCAAAPPAPSAVVPVVSVPAGWSDPAASDAQAGPPVDLTSWWRSFGDGALDGLVARSLAASPDLDACAARVRAVRAMARDEFMRELTREPVVLHWRGGGGGGGTGSACDILLKGISMDLGGMMLLDDVDLTIVHGRKYALIAADDA
jgi:hypothetical protein